MSPEILLHYLKVAKQYGPRAGRIDARFCADALGIAEPLFAVVTLHNQGHHVSISPDGGLHLVREAMQ